MRYMYGGDGWLSLIILLCRCILGLSPPGWTGHDNTVASNKSSEYILVS